MNPDYTHVSMLLDRSGSMEQIANDAIGGFNSFLADQKKLPGDMTLTLCQFDTEFESLYNFVPILDVPELNRKTFLPRGGTALFDAVKRTINETGSTLAKLPDNTRPGKVILVILTDGEENSSKETTKEELAAMVKHQEEKYNWHFVYLGANQDAFKAGGAIGMSGVNYQGTSKGMAATFRAFSSNTASNRGASTYAAITQDEVDEAGGN